jgi:hypothetical protein
VAGVLARLSWLGIAREAVPGLPVLPSALVPVDASGYEPADTIGWLLDVSVQTGMGAVAGAVPGVAGSALSFGGSLYPDSGGWWLDNLLGDLSGTSNGALGVAQSLTAPLSPGAAQLTVGSSLGAVTTGSVIQIADGAASELVVASPGSSGTAVNFAGTPCRFAHPVTATAALETAAGGYQHVFAALNSGSGQPPTHTLTDTTGLTAGTGARAYAGAVITKLDLAGDPGQGLVTAKVTGLAQPSQPSAAAVIPGGAASGLYGAGLYGTGLYGTGGAGGGYVPPFAGWQSTVLVGGTLPYAGPWAVSLSRPVVVYRSAQNPAVPQNMPRGRLDVTGALGYPDPADETPLLNMLTGGLMPVQISLANGLSGAAALGLTITCSQAQFTTAKPDRTRPAIGYATTWQAAANDTDSGGSGGDGPGTVTLVNATSAY